MSDSNALKVFLEDYPATQMVELLIPDLAGILRGKRVQRRELESIFSQGFTLPGATLFLNAQGRVTERVSYGGTDGDPDVFAKVVEQSLAPVPWAERECGQALFTFYATNGEPYFADSRHVLTRVAKPLIDMGLTIVMAIELEFYLLDASSDKPLPKLPKVFGTDQTQSGPQTYIPDDLWQIDAFLNELNDVCERQQLPIGTALSEFGPGQYEINLHHVSDAVLACDHAVLLKRAIKAVAHRHGFVACFMAKPFSETSGSGLHVHTSLVDAQGDNYFSQDKQELASPPFGNRLRHAVGGLLQTMPENMAVFAPNANSYRRLRPDFYAPVMPNWGSNHRDVSVRIPLSDKSNTRIEHRTSGADANPYLVAAAVLMGIHHGLTESVDPGEPILPGDEVEMRVELPIRWEAALDQFEASQRVAKYFGEEFHRNYALARRDESEQFYYQVTERDFQWYLRHV